MNKIATYLNEHLIGEATSSKPMRRRFSRDGSILSITPEIIVFPRVTNDIRKVARFAWQLAEKGHTMGLTARGTGADVTGAAIGKGVVIDTSAHMHRVITLAPKDRLIHVQPGVTIQSLQHALNWHGLSLAQVPSDACHITVAGAIANNTLGDSGAIADSIDKLEVVLANGDIIETGRISRHEVNKKLGLQTFEGEIYRKLSGLLEDNEETVAQLASDATRDNVGYKNISIVKRRDGSMDLTPLFIGSQGTLGIISEIVLQTDYFSPERSAAVIVASSNEFGRDIADRIKELSPSALFVYEGGLFERLEAQGKKLQLISAAETPAAVVVVSFDDFSDRARHSKLKKLRKLTAKMGISMIDSEQRPIEEFDQLQRTVETTQRLADEDKQVLPLLDGMFVPMDRLEEFTSNLTAVAQKHHVTLPLKINVLTGGVSCNPHLRLDSVSDKQKLFRLMNDVAELVHRCNGAFVSDGAEGRLKATAAWASLNEAEVALYEAVRAIFDPFGTLNPGVKQKTDIRGVVSSLRSSYDTTDFVA